MKRLSFLNLIVCCVFCFMFTGCEKYDYKAYANQAKTTVVSEFDNQSINYTSVEVEYKNDRVYNNENYKVYYIIVSVSGQEMSLLFEIATKLENINFSQIPNEANMVFMRYVKQDEKLYQISSTDEFQLEADYAVVYDSIKAKSGINLTNKEKARIYKELNYYYTKLENGDYKYSESQAEKIVAEKYDLTTEFLKQDIWTPKIWEYYDLYYNHH